MSSASEPSTTPEYVISTLGCKANFSDSQDLEATLQNRGWKKSDLNSTAAQLCIVNSCTVTDEADRQSRRMASKLARKFPNASIVITGCGAEVAPEKLKNTRGVHYVIGNQNKTDFVDILLERLERDSAPASGAAEIIGSVRAYSELLSKHPMDREWPAVNLNLRPEKSSQTRAFFKIQEGCNSFCTYCIIPYGRGPSRSLSLEQISKQVAVLESTGVKEIVLTGTNLGDYGTDLEKATFEDAVEAILKSTRTVRVRLSSLDPTEITPRLRALVKTESRLCPHFHVSLQSPINKILRLMKRKYGESQIEECLQSISALSLLPGGVFVGMDLITGFPEETDDDFRRGFELLEKLPWSRLHVFPYSEREGTPATRLKGVVAPHVRKERTRILNRLSLARLRAHYEKAWTASQGTFNDILTERGGHGYTANYLSVRMPQTLENQLVSAKIVSLQENAAQLDVHFAATFI